MTDNIVSLVDVHKRFGKNEVLRGATVHIPKGVITYIIGRSGEGKSVTLKHIVGILFPDSGYLEFDGQRMPDHASELWIDVRKKMGLLFQDGALFDSLSVFENVVFALREHSNLTDLKLRARCDELLNLVGLPNFGRKSPGSLSIGEKKRVGLARALALSPMLLMYDEPTTGMDPIVSELVDALIVSTQKSVAGLSSVVISHDISSILNTAENIVMLHEGVIYFQGTPHDFVKSEDVVVKQFLSGSTQGPLAKPIA